MMQNIADLIYEARHLKSLPRSGYQFLGAGNESVAEHTFMTAFIGFVISRQVPEADPLRLISMCLVHDLTEARIGDLNYVQKQYLRADEEKAAADLLNGLPFANDLGGLIEEFSEQETLESQLAHDADQISLILDLKAMIDTGYLPPATWVENVRGRLKTDIGRRISNAILDTHKDHWWRKNYVDRTERNF